MVLSAWPRVTQAAPPEPLDERPLGGDSVEAEPEQDRRLESREIGDEAALALIALPALSPPQLLALPPMPAMIGSPVLAKRARDRSFDTSSGEVDPRIRPLPRTHRFRLAIHSHWVRLPQTPNEKTGETVRFHLAPLMIDVAYQAQFLRFVMVRIALAAGYNVANTRNSMPIAIFPQAYVGFQHKVVGVAFGYGYDALLPPVDGATDGGQDSLQQPVLRRTHVVMGEFSATSRVDRVALTFSLALGGIQSDLYHYVNTNPVTREWRFYLGLQAGVFFDGTIRKERKARKKAAAEGR
jgi:hypothetical protein